MTAYYNDSDPHAAAWARELVARGLVPAGDVDDRPIQEVEPDDLAGYDQVHLFAGIGGWPLALALAGVPDLACWTGSCPCQPFSTAGRRRGTDDDRHLWPHFLRLLEVRHPPVVFGEQVASPLGRGWLAGVRADLERVGYAVGAADLPAACVGAPHIRQRLWWVAHAEVGRRREGRQDAGRSARRGGEVQPRARPADDGADRDDRLADAVPPRRGTAGEGEGPPDAAGRGVARVDGRGVGHTEQGGRSRDTRRRPGDEPEITGRARRAPGEVALPVRVEGRLPVPRRRPGQAEDTQAPGRGAARGVADAQGAAARPGDDLPEGQPDARRRSPLLGPLDHWTPYALVPCADGRTRRTQPGVHPLAHGIPGRVALLRGLGNAVVPQVAALFVTAAVEAIDDLRRLDALERHVLYGAPGPEPRGLLRDLTDDATR